MELILENIQKKFEEKEVLRGAGFTFEKGKIYGLLGRNGAGKTTLFNCISREIPYEEGTVVLQDEGKSIPLDHDNIGYAFSMPVMPEFLTGYEFIKFFIDINRGKLKEVKTVEEYADMVSLEHADLDRLLKGYSHGMKNKMQMLCLLISRPPVILLDEPLTSLDVVAAHDMKEMLLEMKQDHIIILSTHILQLAQDLCDEIVLLHGGVLTGVNDMDVHEESFEEHIMQLLSSPEETTGEDMAENDFSEQAPQGFASEKNMDIAEEQGDEDPYEY